MALAMALAAADVVASSSPSSTFSLLGATGSFG
jgi:hypothetical protein